MKLWENFRGMGKKEGFTPCEDKIDNCEIHKANGGCLEANKDHMSWRTSCVKTCGYCDDPKHNPALNWTYCADENGVCNINGKEIIRYGESISSNYIDKEFGTVGQDTAVNCNNSTFTDPIVGTPKKCWKKPATNTASQIASQIATAIGIKNPNNITEHTMENNNLSWEQAQKKCQNNKKNLASKSELIGFIQDKDDGNSWTPVSDGINNWLQIGKIGRAHV